MGPEKAGRLATSIPREEECQENQGVARTSSYSAQGVSCRKAMRRQSNSTFQAAGTNPGEGMDPFCTPPVATSGGRNGPG